MILKTRRFVLIVQVGTSAAAQAKRTDTSLEVKIIQEENVVSYGSCGISYVIDGVVEKFENLIIRSAEEFEEKQNIKIIQNTRATKIIPEKKLFMQKIY